jgi:hypothetical protein
MRDPESRDRSIGARLKIATSLDELQPSTPILLAEAIALRSVQYLES